MTASRARRDAYKDVFRALAHPARRRVLLTVYFDGGAMSATERPTTVRAKPPKHESPDDVPQFFRLNVEVADLTLDSNDLTKLNGFNVRETNGHVR